MAAMGLFRKRCKTFHCPNLHQNPNGFCDACNTKRAAAYLHNPVAPYVRVDARPSAAQRGYDFSWHKFASDFLSRHPACAICGKPANCVDHRDVPAEIMLDMHGRFDLDPNLYQALCTGCNRRKAYADSLKVAAYFRDKAKLEAHHAAN
jgi:5-methylcytosine-specific restriction protein A